MAACQNGGRRVAPRPMIRRPVLLSMKRAVPVLQRDAWQQVMAMR